MCVCVCVCVCVIHEGLIVPADVVGVASGSLVPGDVLVVPPSGLTVPCDAALLTGHVVVNEAMLTGIVSYMVMDISRQSTLAS